MNAKLTGNGTLLHIMCPTKLNDHDEDIAKRIEDASGLPVGRASKIAAFRQGCSDAGLSNLWLDDQYIYFVNNHGKRKKFGVPLKLEILSHESKKDRARLDLLGHDHLGKPERYAAVLWVKDPHDKTTRHEYARISWDGNDQWFIGSTNEVSNQRCWMYRAVSPGLPLYTFNQPVGGHILHGTRFYYPEEWHPVPRAGIEFEPNGYFDPKRITAQHFPEMYPDYIAKHGKDAYSNFVSKLSIDGDLIGREGETLEAIVTKLVQSTAGMLKRTNKAQLSRALKYALESEGCIELPNLPSMLWIPKAVYLSVSPLIASAQELGASLTELDVKNEASAQQIAAGISDAFLKEWEQVRDAASKKREAGKEVEALTDLNKFKKKMGMNRIMLETQAASLSDMQKELTDMLGIKVVSTEQVKETPATVSDETDNHDSKQESTTLENLF